MKNVLSDFRMLSELKLNKIDLELVYKMHFGKITYGR